MCQCNGGTGDTTDGVGAICEFGSIQRTGRNYRRAYVAVFVGRGAGHFPDYLFSGSIFSFATLAGIRIAMCR